MFSVSRRAIPPLLNLVQTSPSVETREQAVWCLSNVAGDCASLRDMLLGCGESTHRASPAPSTSALAATPLTPPLLSPPPL